MVVGQGVVEEGVHRRVLLGQVLHEAVEAPHEVAGEEVVAGALRSNSMDILDLNRAIFELAIRTYWMT